MRTAFAYTSARILMFGVSVIVLYLAGARGILLLGLGLVISALGSYILLNKQREIIAARLNGRLSRVGSKAAEFRARLEEGTSMEDADEDPAEVTDAPAAPGEPAAPREPAASGEPAAPRQVL
jgi:UPF0716 family protein affecting phage T7 exclusion